ncbi:MAG: NAD(P)/FAD-dependent oxidoreductase [Candidatus Aenigmarchaeota archaeon]|nr:NAD(P)/FAD-dependent oxidoreductase [Candidatus Aenigmarchaeota archaeon]
MYDVIIAGSGIAGSTIARGLGGLDVLVLEKNKKAVPKDSGIVSRRFLEHYDRKFIRHEITEIELVSRSRRFFLKDENPFAFILHRERFAEFLLRETKKSADFKNESIISADISEKMAVVTTDKGSYEGRVVIGCDGASSALRKAVGISPPKLSVGVMVKGGGVKSGHIRTFFNKDYSPDFFSWIIPQSDEYGLMAGSGSGRCLERFASEQGLGLGKTYAYMIPTGMTKSYSDRCILAGDACGQNKPLTGGGIIFSLIGARHASSTIKMCAEKNRFDKKILSLYERAWKKEIAFEIRKQLLMRRAYARMNNDDIDRIFSDFGSHMESLRGFDYDNFSRSWRHLPKMKLAKFVISNIHSAFI